MTDVQRGQRAASAGSRAMSAYEAELAAELKRVRDAQHALWVRAAHVESTLRLARQGVPEGILRATLESKGIVLLVRPVAGSVT